MAGYIDYRNKILEIRHLHARSRIKKNAAIESVAHRCRLDLQRVGKFINVDFWPVLESTLQKGIWTDDKRVQRKRSVLKFGLFFQSKSADDIANPKTIKI